MSEKITIPKVVDRRLGGRQEQKCVMLSAHTHKKLKQLSADSGQLMRAIVEMLVDQAVVAP